MLHVWGSMYVYEHCLRLAGNKDLGDENQKQIEMKAKKKKDEQMQERNETECDRRQRGN
jgi:hypothetical protein